MNTESILRHTLTLIIVIGSIICLSIVSYGIIETIYNNEMSKPIEYSYKNFSERDIELAMHYNGVTSVTLTETECYFIRDNVKCNLFNDATIKFLYENKQKEVKK